MRLKDWLESERGRATAMAEHFNVNKTAVFGWKVHGVPPNRMLAVRDFTAGEVSLEDMADEHAEDKPAAEAA